MADDGRIGEQMRRSEAMLQRIDGLVQINSVALQALREIAASRPSSMAASIAADALDRIAAISGERL